MSLIFRNLAGFNGFEDPIIDRPLSLILRVAGVLVGVHELGRDSVVDAITKAAAAVSAAVWAAIPPRTNVDQFHLASWTVGIYRDHPPSHQYGEVRHG